jgi:hypothetical protein
VDLASDGEDILLEVGGDFGIVLVVGLAVEQGEVGRVDGKSFFQNGEDAVFFDFAIEAFENEPLPVGAVLEFGEFGGLGGFKKAPKFCSIDGEGTIEVGGDAGFIAGRLNQGSFDAVFEGLFVGLADHSASDAWRSILFYYSLLSQSCEIG